MNQSNQSLQVSKNNCFSEHIFPSNNSQQYDVEYFFVCDNLSTPDDDHNPQLTKSYASRECAEILEAELKAEYPHCFTNHWTALFASEFKKGRQELLTRIIGATSGTFFVVYGGEDGLIKNQLISPEFQSLEQATAWRYLSLPYYPDCQIVEYGSSPGGRSITLSAQSLLAGHHIMAFAVVYGGDGERRCSAIGDRYFTTEAQARCYQSEILSEYPKSQISQQNFHFDHIYQRQRLLEHLFGYLKSESADCSGED